MQPPLRLPLRLHLLHKLSWRLGWMLPLCLALLLGTPAGRAQGVEATALHLNRGEAGLTLDFSARLTLSRSIEDALQRGVPMYFSAQATLWRSRWYWRDERVARANRTWRLSYQPLTASWRVALGALSQNYASLGEALAVVASIGRWKLAESGALDPDEHYYVEFSYRLDTSQLPRPMQIGLGGDWSLGLERTLQVD
ncbi:hypothetical protein BurJ1DRAFT_0882 [Burkholderiales bacterium JOSHI_001]|nr:hypothetical protein BurJ1DRAFT_0882 [Burkholderiales bacterium JOSHI_001]